MGSETIGAHDDISVPSVVLHRLRERMRKMGFVSSRPAGERYTLPGHPGHYIESGWGAGAVWVAFFRHDVRIVQMEITSHDRLLTAFSQIVDWKDHV